MEIPANISEDKTRGQLRNGPSIACVQVQGCNSFLKELLEVKFLIALLERVPQTQSSRHGASPISEKLPKDSSECKIKDCSRWLTEDSASRKIVPENSSGNSRSYYSVSYKPKCNQLFYGLPSLHSESLKTTAWVSRSSYTSPSPPILFNRISNGCPVQVSPLLSPPQPLSHTEPQPRRFILTTPQTQIFPLSPVLTQAHRISSLPIPPPPSTSQMGTYGISCPIGQSEAQSLVTEIQRPEPSLLGKQLESKKTLPSVMKRSKEAASPLSPELPQYNWASEVHRPDSIHPRQDSSRTEFHKLLKQHFQKTSTQHQESLPNMILETPKLTQLQGKLPGPCQAKDQHGPSWPSVFIGDSRTDVKKMRSCHQESCDVRNPEDFQLGKVLENSLGEIPKHSMSQGSETCPVKVLQTRAEAVFQGQNLQVGCGEKATSNWSSPTDERKHFRRPEAKEHEKSLPGLRTTQESRMSHLPMKTSAQNKRSAESLGIKPSQISTEIQCALPEVHIKKTSKFVQSICPNHKEKEYDDPLHKGKPTSNSVYNHKPAKSKSILMDSGVAEAQTLMTAVSHILVEKLGLQEKSCVSKLNQTKEKMPERMSLVGGHPSSQISHSSPEHRGQTSDTVYRNHVNQMARIRHKMTHEGNRNLYTMVGFNIRDREPVSPTNPHKQESMMDSGGPHHSTFCHQNHFSYNQPENASQAFSCRKSFPIQSKSVYPHFSTFPMC
ncbi:PREDICTED: spermatogenesis-associated protein 31-like [Chrysochloris asiatica]|uniref:Spermatogenesis-associated protein 31-like n=1 Tax=Chrysochloris asiatica TaxID=185453 RepID=A0A9B0WUS0_CHRAS|nr:PREDICTED: spermatogenesis-associated protein 31-like [Chrysochloris asiatica]